MAEQSPIVVVDRESGSTFEETVLGENWIRWAYQDSRSGLLERLLFQSPWLSRLMGSYYDAGLSQKKIPQVIQELAIDMSECAQPLESFASFNAFFARSLKPEARPYNDDANEIVSPADGRVLVFPKLDEDVFAPVKGYPFSIRTMLPEYSARYEHGALAIVRLCPADYHRYHFPCAGTIVASADFPGALHSVNPIALASGADVFGENKRSYTLIETEDFGTVCFMEVGAFGVGSIINTCTTGTVQKMDEKGYFKFGGSTVVLLFEPGRIQFCEDLLANSSQGLETLIRVGQPLAHHTA